MVHPYHNQVHKFIKETHTLEQISSELRSHHNLKFDANRSEIHHALKNRRLGDKQVSSGFASAHENVRPLLLHHWNDRWARKRVNVLPTWPGARLELCCSYRHIGQTLWTTSSRTSGDCLLSPRSKLAAKCSAASRLHQWLYKRHDWCYELSEQLQDVQLSVKRFEAFRLPPNPISKPPFEK